MSNHKWDNNRCTRCGTVRQVMSINEFIKLGTPPAGMVYRWRMKYVYTMPMDMIGLGCLDTKPWEKAPLVYKGNPDLIKAFGLTLRQKDKAGYNKYHREYEQRRKLLNTINQ